MDGMFVLPVLMGVTIRSDHSSFSHQNQSADKRRKVERKVRSHFVDRYKTDQRSGLTIVGRPVETKLV